MTQQDIERLIELSKMSESRIKEGIREHMQKVFREESEFPPRVVANLDSAFNELNKKLQGVLCIIKNEDRKLVYKHYTTNEMMDYYTVNELRQLSKQLSKDKITAPMIRSAAKNGKLEMFDIDGVKRVRLVEFMRWLRSR